MFVCFAFVSVAVVRQAPVVAMVPVSTLMGKCVTARSQRAPGVEEDVPAGEQECVVMMKGPFLNGEADPFSMSDQIV